MVFCGSLILRKGPRPFTGFTSTSDKSILTETIPFWERSFATYPIVRFKFWIQRVGDVGVEARNKHESN